MPLRVQLIGTNAKVAEQRFVVLAQLRDDDLLSFNVTLPADEIACCRRAFKRPFPFIEGGAPPTQVIAFTCRHLQLAVVLNLLLLQLGFARCKLLRILVEFGLPVMESPFILSDFARSAIHLCIDIRSVLQALCLTGRGGQRI